MSKKLRIAVPLCGLLAVAVVALFCVSGWAAGEENMQPKTVVVETMNAQGMEAPGKTLETLARFRRSLRGRKIPKRTISHRTTRPLREMAKVPMS